MTTLRRKVASISELLLCGALMFVLWLATVLGAMFAVALPFMMIGAAGYGVYLGFIGMRWIGSLIVSLLGAAAL